MGIYNHLSSPPLSSSKYFSPWYHVCSSPKLYMVLKVLMQGKLFQRCTHFLYCSVMSLGGKVNTRRMSQPDMGSIFTKIIYEIFWPWETIMLIFKIIKIKSFYPPRILDEQWGIYSFYKFRPERTGFNMYAEYTQPQLTFLALVPWDHQPSVF